MTQIGSNVETLYEVEAAIMNIGNVVFDRITLLLPLNRPEGVAGVYNTVVDEQTQVYWISP